ncbi:MAG: hypothetical protein HDT39_08195 [Lachnospiraceae bacterium]|nr:hypothetical protein [Lachnospiraceae bacterium]
MEDAFSVVLQQIHSYNKKSLLIAIDGRCAAGKTTLAALLKEETGCNVIHMDHFFLQPGQRTEERMQEPGGNVDYERVLNEVMIPLSQGLDVSYRKFDCKKMELSSSIQIHSDGVTIVEGSYSCHPTLWDFYDLRVFLSINPEEQIRRIRCRNGNEAFIQFRDRWIPLEERYFSAYNIQECCDFVFQM